MSVNEIRSHQYIRPRQLIPDIDEPGPRKRRTGLVIGLIIGAVVLIVIVIVVILLIRRNSAAQGPPKVGCQLTPCPSGKRCNGTDGSCVDCLTPSHCSAPTPYCELGSHTCVGCLGTPNCQSYQTCNANTCQNQTCTTTPDCIHPETPFCVTGFCQQCVTNTDCSSNPIYSGDGKNFCDPSNTCVECLVDTNCPTTPNATCETGVCCDKNPPVILFVGTNTAANSSINGSYAWTQTGADLTVVVKLQALSVPATGSITGTTMTVTSVGNGFPLRVGTWIVGDGSVLPGTQITALGTGTGGIGTYTINRSQTLPLDSLDAYEDIFLTTPAGPTGTFMLTQSNTGLTFYPNESYAIVIMLTSSCVTVHSLAWTFTMPSCAFLAAPTLNPGTAADVNGAIKGFRVNSNVILGAASGMVITRIQGAHPNLVFPGHGHVVRNVTGVPAGPSYTYTALWTAPPALTTTGGTPDVVAGQTWYGRLFRESQGQCISDLSAETSTVVTP